MTVRITVRNKNAQEIMDMVKKLREDGYVQGQDFDFAFYQRRWDPMIGDIEGSTVFTFYKEKYASLFALKYGS